jgi:hypothetical protein
VKTKNVDWRLILAVLTVSVFMLLGLIEFKMSMVRILMPIFGVSLLGYMFYVLMVALGIKFWEEKEDD